MNKPKRKRVDTLALMRDIDVSLMHLVTERSIRRDLKTPTLHPTGEKTNGH